MNKTATQIMEAREAGRMDAIMGRATAEAAARYTDPELAECWNEGVAEGMRQIAEQAAQDKHTRRVKRERR